MKPLTLHALTTRIFRAQENLSAFVIESVPRPLIQEGIVLAVTSKIVSLAENRLVSRSTIDKKTLVQKEADTYLGEIGHGCFLTIKSGLLIPSAGIDESNSVNGDFIIFPKNPFLSAQNLLQDLRKIWNLKNLGLVITDSHTTPLRRGVTGICLSYAGFNAVRNLIGSRDLFGRELKMTQMNFADGLAASAVMLMGEGAESRPLVVIENSAVEFCETTRTDEINIPLEEDLYFPLLQTFLTQSTR